MDTETTPEAQARFMGQGYQGRARREAGAIRFLDDGGLYLPEQVVVEGLARTRRTGRAEDFVFALYSPKSAQRATLALPGGGREGMEQAALVARLLAPTLF